MIDGIFNIFLQIPCCVFWKNLNLEFMGGNNHFANVAGLTSVTEIKGKTDYDFPWAQDHADLYRQWDKKVLSGLTITQMLEPQIQASGQLVKVLVNKSPLYNERGEVIGLIGSYIEHITHRNKSPKISLSKKQNECLHYVSQGLTAKQIANAMSLSTRTVESYIDILKKKFSCRNKLELISKTLSSHFL